MFTPSRLTFARKRRGLTKTNLAKLVDVTQQAISDFECGRHSPRQDTLDKIADTLEFPVEFFYEPDLDELSTDAVSFRSLSKMTASKRDSALSSGRLAILLNDWIEERFSLPNVDLIDLRSETPESAAMILRQHWGFGERPIKNMIHLLEAKGVRVYSLAEEDSEEVDAFSLWYKGKPFVFLNTIKSAERSRFDAAHELGHLVLHKHGAPHGQDAERQADAFASTFLMPESSVKANCPSMPSLRQLIKLKHNWIVSVAALTYRLHAIGKISDWHYRMLCIEIAKSGYRTQEPEGAQRETSQILGKVFSALRDDKVKKSKIAQALKVSTRELEKLIFGLTMVAIPGGGVSKGQTTKPSLQIID